MKQKIYIILVLFFFCEQAGAQGSQKFKVYFNHPVDTTFKTQRAAVNLGNKLIDTLIAYINRCEATLDIAIYNSFGNSSSSGIAGAINDAHARGVRVRVIYDGSTTSSMINQLNSGIRRLASPQGFSFGLMHHKFVVFDAFHSNPNKPKVWTGSTNWTTAQISGPDLNSAIVVQDRALAETFTIEFEEMWGSNGAIPNAANSKFGPNKTDNTPKNFEIDGILVECYFSPSDGTNAQILNTINAAQSDINIATMLITRTDIRNAITNRYSLGVSDVNVLVDSQNPSGNQFFAIQQAIGSNRAFQSTFSGSMHHKFMVVNHNSFTATPRVLVGSHNWSNNAEQRNDENTLIIHDAEIANLYYQAFAYMFNFSGGALYIPKSENWSQISFFPNPSQGVVNYHMPHLSNTLHTLQVINTAGKVVYTQNLQADGDFSIDLSALANGLYQVVIAGNKHHYSGRIIIQH